jgi:hypothetical protein
MPRSLLPLLLALVVAPPAGAAGGRYAFDGGTCAERAQVTAALDASSFNWSIVPGRVVVHIEPNLVSAAAPGEIWLDSTLLDAGRFSWGVVQHEYAHLVDFALLSDATRAQLAAQLGGSAWWGEAADQSQLGSERFADALAWSYWPSPDNVLKPRTMPVSPAGFRALLSSLLAPRLLSGRNPISPAWRTR